MGAEKRESLDGVTDNLAKLLKTLPPLKLHAFVNHQLGGVLPTLNVRQPKEKLGKHLAAALVALDPATQKQIEKVAGQLMLLTDRPGQDVVEGLREGIFSPAEQKEFNHLPNEYERALWLYLHAPRLFKEALDARHADILRQTRSCYAGFIAPKRLVIVNNGAVRHSFHEQVTQRLGCAMQALTIHIFMRRRLDLQSGEEVDLYQISLHHNAELRADEGEASCKQSFYLTYEPASGELEALSEIPEQREALARITVDTLFRQPFSGQKIPLKQYDYQRLALPCVFDLSDEDSVAFVKVTELGCTQADRTLQVKTWVNDQEDICTAAQSLLGANFNFHQHQLTYAKLSIRLKKTGQDRARILAVILSGDNRCDIKAKGERDRKLCERLLAKWQLIKEIGEAEPVA